MAIRGAIFDLDGTLVDSGLDFDLMRREMELAPGLPLLEAIEQLSGARSERCWAILAEHELAGARRSTLYPGVREFVQALETRGLRRAVFTRNSRAIACDTLERLELAFDPILGREDAAVKPDPEAIWKNCANWGLRPGECCVIGDHRFDILAGRRAGAHTVLFAPPGHVSGLADHEQADHTLASFAEPSELWAWLDQIDLEGCGGCC